MLVKTSISAKIAEISYPVGNMAKFKAKEYC
jgi:hypothetical protein